MVEMMNIHQDQWNSGISSRSSTLVDVSSFLLFESTGDSEFDSSFYSTSDHDPMDSLISLNPSHQRFLEDDDAQSCSYECGSHVDHVDDDDDDMDLDFQIENNDNDDDSDGDDVDSSRCSRGYNHKSVGWNSGMEDEDEDEDEGGVVEQGWMNGINRCNKKSKSNVNSVVDSKFMSQKDKDKLFWETCLAS